ncbi:MAG: NAD-dependent epimerase/dehydratase family protein, partial [Acidimicrobiales bacterium]
MGRPCRRHGPLVHPRVTDHSPLTGTRALVTGAAGFIGSALCQRLLALGTEVHGVSRADRSAR